MNPPCTEIFFEQVGTPNGKAHANAGHAIELGEGAQNDDVLAVLHEVERAWRIAEVNIGLVDQQDRVFGSIGHRIFDLGLRRAGSGGVVGVADVDHAGVGRGSEHRLDVVLGFAFGIGERHLENISAGNLARPTSGAS